MMAPLNAVETDAGQAHFGLGLATGFGDDHDRLAGPSDVAGVLGESAVEGHVDRTADVTGREHFWGAPVDDDGAFAAAPFQPGHVEKHGRVGVVEQVAAATVGVGREREVAAARPADLQ